jgi:hypothetical protein
MPTFVELPRELVAKILSLVLSTYEEAPQDVSDPSGRAEFDDLEFSSWRSSYGVMYIEQPAMRDATSLLLLNHQLHNETLETIRLLPNKHSYVLDLIIANEEKLWPTWLYAPVYSTRVDKVYAAIRTIGYLQKRGYHSNNIFEGGGPHRITLSFWNLIERFLKVGPVGRRMRKNDRRISLKELVIDVHSPDPVYKILPMDHSGQFRAQAYRENNGPDYLMNPEYILQHILGDIRGALAMGNATASYGSLVYERVGSIKVLMDGELHKEWDLAKCLNDVQFNNSFGNYPREKRTGVFRKWKRNAYKARVEFGLPVIKLERKDKGKDTSSA